MFKPGEIVVKKSDRGIPGLTLHEYSVAREPYTKKGELWVDLTGGTGSRRYSTAYRADQFEVLTEEKRAKLLAFHGMTA